MEIKEITGGYVTIQLDPGQCLALAEACDTKGNEESEENQPERAAYFDLLQGAFEALGLLATAKCYMRQDDGGALSLAHARTEYPVVPRPARKVRP